MGTDRLSEDVSKEELVVLATGRAASELPVMPVVPVMYGSRSGL